MRVEWRDTAPTPTPLGLYVADLLQQPPLSIEAITGVSVCDNVRPHHRRGPRSLGSRALTTCPCPAAGVT
jgi:hypothetical protein